jgi:ParB-like chromosome segregation protein Spo0J
MISDDTSTTTTGRARGDPKPSHKKTDKEKAGETAPRKGKHKSGDTKSNKRKPPSGAAKASALYALPVVLVPIALLSVHPLTEGIPRLPPQQHQELTEDIGQHGVKHPLLIDRENRILDGRHRYEAALKNGHTHVPCRVVDCTEEEARDIIYREAILRRHLSDDTRAMLAADWRKGASQQAKTERARKGGQAGGRNRTKSPDSSQNASSHKQSATSTRAQAAEMMNVSERKVRQAIELREKAPDLAEKVKDGELTLAEAKKQLAARQAAAVAAPTGDGEGGKEMDKVAAPAKPKRQSHLMLDLAASDEKLARTLLNVLGKERAARLVARLQQWLGDTATPEEEEVKSAPEEKEAV